ncbi:MAG: secretin N-terminal domain-containing protein [Rickettsiaceae bacterium]|nr:secretin N-terminal domain-containing protein [Rickettsiaceae bacterium]
MSKNNKKILHSCIIMLSMFLSSCTDNSNPKFFDDNIKEFNEFSNDLKEDDKEDKVLVFKNPFNQSCKKANLVAKGIKLNQLAALLSETYESEISYAINSDAQGNIASATANKDKDVTAPNVLSVNFKDVCLEEVLDTLTDVYNIGVVDTSSGYQLYQSPSQTITYELNYHNFQRKGSSAISITSSQLTNTSTSNSKDNKNYSTITSTSEDKFWESVTSAISSILHIAPASSATSRT